MDFLGDFAAVLRVVAFLDEAFAILDERLVKEPRPLIQHLDLFAREVGETPAFVGVLRTGLVVVADGLEKIDDAAQEMRAEDADGAVVEQVYAVIRADLVVAEVRVAVDDAVAIERDVPGTEQGFCDVVAHFHGRIFVEHALQGAAGEPGHGEEAPGGRGHHRLGYGDAVHIAQHDAVEAHLGGLADVVELFTQAFGEFLVDFFVLYRLVHAVIDRQGKAQLTQIGFDDAWHVGILQLAGDVGAIGEAGAVDLAETGGGGGFAAEFGKAALPVRAQFGGHAAADEGDAHRRGVRLQLREFGGVFGRQRVRHGGEELRDFHQRAFEAAEDGF